MQFRKDSFRAGAGALAIGAMYLVLGWLMVSCRGPYDAAWRTTAAVKEAGTLTDKAIATAMRERLEKCKKESDVAACIRNSREWKAVQEWRKWGVPAVNSAIVGTVAALQIAEKTKAKNVDWISTLKPAACALSRVLKEWTFVFPKGTQTAIEAAVKMLGNVSCEVK